jgi:mRNA interferase MazF
MTIRQGDIYWVNLGSPKGSEPGFRHPHVVIQNDAQVVTVNKSDLKDKIGSLSSERTREIIEGIKLLVGPLPDPRP